MVDLSLLIPLVIAVVALVVSILSAYYSKTQSDSAREELKLHKEELNSSETRFLLRRNATTIDA